MNQGRSIRQILIALCLFSLVALLTPISSITASPIYQEPTCLSAQGCREPVNPVEGEYYSIECDASVIYVWRDVPNRELVTLIGIAQVAIMGDGGSFVASGDVTVTRSGDMITLSGENGNFAPQSGEKSFSIDQCRAFAAIVLPAELIFPTATLTDEQMECMQITDEVARVECNQRLACADSTFRNSNPERCELGFFPDCERLTYFYSELRKCLRQSDLTWIGVQLAQAFYIWYRCVFGGWPLAALVMLPSIHWLRRRKRRGGR